MASNNDAGLPAFEYDPRNGQYQYNSRFSWPLQQHSQPSSSSSAPMNNNQKRSTSPLPMPLEATSYQQSTTYPPVTLMGDWQMPSQAPATTFALDTTSFTQAAFDGYGAFQASPTDYMQSHASLDSIEAASMEANLSSNLGLDGSFVNLPTNMTAMNMNINWSDVEFLGYTATHGLPDMMATGTQTFGSPSETYLSDSHLEVQSIPSSSSDHGWTNIEQVSPHVGAIFNPSQTLHPRTFSDSTSYSDTEQHSHTSWDGCVEVPLTVGSPGTDSAGEMNFHSDQEYNHDHLERSPPAPVTTAIVRPIAITPVSPTSPQRSPTSLTARKQSRKSPISKASSSKVAARRPSQAVKGETEKRVGRRKGPLRPDQRKQASEIRKLGACIRCRFLKKTVSPLICLPDFQCVVTYPVIV